MHVFLTGASGYLGSRVATRLRSSNHVVTGLVRRQGSAPDGVEEVIGALADTAMLGEQAARADAILHTAFGHSDDFEEATESERLALDAIVDAIRGSGKPLIVSSAAGVLGDTGSAPARDDAKVSSDFPARIRGHLEERVRANADRINMSAMRLPVLVHGHGASQFVPLLIDVARRDGISRYSEPGTNRLSAVHVDDAADAYILALQTGATGRVYNVASETLTAGALAEAVAKGAGVNRIEGVTLEGMQEATHPFVALLLSMNFDLDAAATRRDLGWVPSGPSLVEDLSSGSYANSGA